MELLYRSTIPGATIHGLAWSRLNHLAVSVSISKDGIVGKNFGSSKNYQMLVMDPDRPWHYHCVYMDIRTVTRVMKWSCDCSRILTVDDDSVARVWKMKERCLNSWQRTHRVELDDPGKLLYTSWVELGPLPSVNHCKQTWPELLEFKPYNPHLNMVIPEAAMFVFSSGKVQVVSFHGNDLVSSEVRLEEDINLCAAKALTLPDGVILCAVGCADGQLKLFVISANPTPGGSFTLTASLSTSFQPTGGGGGQLTDLVMHPDTDGCILHICYDGTNLLQWSLRDILQSGSYQAKREGLYVMSQPITSVHCSPQCLRQHEQTPEATTSSTEFMLVDVVEGEVGGREQWPVELVVMVHQDETVTILSRSSYQKLYQGPVCAQNDGSSPPALKRARQDVDKSHDHLLALSPNSCCLALSSGGTVHMYTLSPFVLGAKDFSSPEMDGWSLLLTLATCTSRSAWDICVMCCRVAYKNKDHQLVQRLLDHWSQQFLMNVGHWKARLFPTYLSAIFFLHCCHEDGLLPALDQRDIARLHSTSSLLLLALPTSESSETPVKDMLRDLCASNKTEDNLENLVKGIVLKDFVIPSDVKGQLQGHCHWVVECAIKIVSRIAATNTKRIPHAESLEILKECILLLYVWNKCLSQPILSVSDGALALLFKVITKWILSPSVPLAESLLNDVNSNIPKEKNPSLLTLTRASHLQGFIHGLNSLELPEQFQYDQPPPLRPHVQKHYTTLDPFSPLGLIVPPGLLPPWRDVFVEGQRDIIHGGSLLKNVIQNARLKQCSRCRNWTIASEGLQDGGGLGPQSQDSGTLPSSNPIQQWRHSWAQHCFCGALWVSHSSSSGTDHNPKTPLP